MEVFPNGSKQIAMLMEVLEEYSQQVFTKEVTDKLKGILLLESLLDREKFWWQHSG